MYTKQEKKRRAPCSSTDAMLQFSRARSPNFRFPPKQNTKSWFPSGPLSLLPSPPQHPLPRSTSPFTSPDTRTKQGTWCLGRSLHFWWWKHLLRFPLPPFALRLLVPRRERTRPCPRRPRKQRWLHLCLSRQLQCCHSYSRAKWVRACALIGQPRQQTSRSSEAIASTPSHRRHAHKAITILS